MSKSVKGAFETLAAWYLLAGSELKALFGGLGISMPADARAQAGGNLVSLAMGITVAVIVTVGVSIPITNDVINSANLTGITATIVGFIPVMLAVLVLVATVGPIMTRTG